MNEHLLSSRPTKWTDDDLPTWTLSVFDSERTILIFAEQWVPRHVRPGVDTVGLLIDGQCLSFRPSLNGKEISVFIIVILDCLVVLFGLQTIFLVLKVVFLMLWRLQKLILFL